MAPKNSNRDEMLDSWKEIARYLGRAVRTVQGWEKHEGLPVHRHQHRKAGTVYAYPGEIDAWREERDESNASRSTVEEVLPGRLRFYGVAAAILAIAVVVAWQLFEEKRRPSGPAPPDSPPWLMIGNFDNRTGQEVFDGTLETALRRELVGSDQLRIAARERLAETLRLMRRSENTALDEALAWEVVRRDGEIGAVLIGRIERLPSGFLLTAELLDPARGLATASFRQELEEPEAFLPAVKQLAAEVQAATLGKPLAAVEARDKPLRSVSTPSLRALRLYTEAERLLREEGLQERAAETLLREAIALDPEFASSHVLLAWALQRLARLPEEYLAPARRAVELADRASVSERYYIRASLEHLLWWATRDRAHLEEALALYGALFRFDPSHELGFTNYVILLMRTGRSGEVVALARDHLEERPDSVYATALLAYALVREEGDLEQARLHVRRARRLQQDLGVGANFVEAFLEFFPVHESWARGDIEGAVEKAERLAESLERERKNRKPLANMVLDFFLEHGMYARAEELQGRYAVFGPWYWEVRINLARLDRESLLEFVLDRRDDADPNRLAQYALQLALLGLRSEAMECLAMLPPGRLSADNEDRILAVQAILALEEGPAEDAIPLLETALARWGPRRPDMLLLFTRMLAKARAGAGEPEQAVGLLESLSARKSSVLIARDVWLQSRLELADLYRDLGRESEASEIESELRRYSAWADPDFPVLRVLDTGVGLQPFNTG